MHRSSRREALVHGERAPVGAVGCRGSSLVGRPRLEPLRAQQRAVEGRDGRGHVVARHLDKRLRIRRLKARMKRKGGHGSRTKPRAAPVLRSRGTVTRRTAGKAERANVKKSSRSLPSGRFATNSSAVSKLRPPRSGFFGRLPDLPGALSAPAAPLKINKRPNMAMESLAYAAFSAASRASALIGQLKMSLRLSRGSTRLSTRARRIAV